jgi:hypothetical protein
MRDLSRALGQAPGARVGSIRSEFTVQGGRVATDDLTLDLVRYPLVLTGWTDFDGRIDYRLRVDRLTERLPSQALDFLSDLKIRPSEVSSLAFTGTVSRMHVLLNGRPVHESIGNPAERDRKLRDLTRTLKDRILR